MSDEKDYEREQEDTAREQANIDSGWSSNGETYYGTRTTYEERDKTPKPLVALPVGVDRLSDLGTLLTIKETAQKLGKSEKTVRRMITRGDLAGSHQVEMSTGKGAQWVVPYSSVIGFENATRQQINPDPVSAELVALRERVAQLENDLTVQRVLADERAHTLEQLHMTWRLSTGKR